jgi:DNA gyrase subunit A
MVIPARTLHTMLFFSDRGKVYSEKAYQIPDANRTDKGIPIVNIISLDAGERITTAVAVPDFEKGGYFTMATMMGKVKRVPLAEFSSVRTSGLIAISLESNDELGWVCQTNSKDELILVTAKGMALRFAETTIRPVGRQAAGVTGIKLQNGDHLASMEVVEGEGSLLILTERGFGKRALLSEYPAKGRANKGVTTLNEKFLEKTGRIVAARVVQEVDEATFISSNGVVLRLKVKDIALTGRSSRGIHLMDIGENDTGASIARLSEKQLKPTNGEPPETQVN